MPGDWHPRNDRFSSDAQRRMWFARDPDAAERVAHKQKKAHKGRTVHLPSHVGKARSGGSFESGPSSIVTGMPRTAVRSNRSSRYGGTPAHGRKRSDSGDISKRLEYGRGHRQVAKGLSFVPTAALKKPVGQVLSEGGKDFGTGWQSAKAAAGGWTEGAGAAKPSGAAGRAGALAGKITGMAANNPGAAAGIGGATAVGTAGGLTMANRSKPQQSMGSVGSFGKADDSRKRTGLGEAYAGLGGLTVGGAIGENWADQRGHAATTRHLADMAGRTHNPEAEHSLRLASRLQKERATRSGKLALGIGTAGTALAYHGASRYQRANRGKPGFAKAETMPAIEVARRRTSRRSYDPEGRRQFRLGAGTAGAAGGGAILVRTGVRELKSINTPRPLHHIKINRRGGLHGAAGIAGLLGAAQLARYSGSSRNRRYT